MSDAQFEYFCAMARSEAGINLPAFKRNMVYRRVLKRLGALGLATFEAYVGLLKGPEGTNERQFFVNALTTNKTSFFREPHHFDHLANSAIPLLRESAVRSGVRKLRFWSAGCSSGPEAYSMGITLAENLSDIDKWDARILATDIDSDMIQRASAGIYNQEELTDVGEHHLRKYFGQLDDEHWGASAPLRKSIVFNQLNLHGEWPMQRKFDAIFCRNVIIYFDKPSQRTLFERFANVMNPNAFLYIGHSESLFKVTDRFEPEGHGIYRKAD